MASSMIGSRVEREQKIKNLSLVKEDIRMT